MKQITTLVCGLIQIVSTSITGVTFMDNFDFEQRYRDVNECNPFYWHPLHLPEECVQMFEKLIRSGLKSLAPYRIVKERPILLEEPDLVNYPYSYIYSPAYRTEYDPGYIQPVQTAKSMNPFEIMFNLLRNDVRDIPSAPSLGVSPYLGVIAMYKQPVSYKSVAMIKKLARAYAKSSTIESYKNYDSSHKENKIKINKKVKNGIATIDKVIKNDDMSAYLKIKKA